MVSVHLLPFAMLASGYVNRVLADRKRVLAENFWSGGGADLILQAYKI